MVVKRKLNVKRLILFLFCVLLFIMFILFGTYKLMISKVSNNDEKQEFIVEEGTNFLSLSKKLKDSNLVKSSFFYELYIKINKPEMLYAGTYLLSENMSVKEIADIFGKGTTYNPDGVYVTLKEGISIEEIASIVSEVTNKSKEEYLTYWQSEEFLNKVIDKYWFVTNDIKNTNLKYALEGYFFPSTYELLNADVDEEYVAYKFLDQMQIVLDKYKDDIEKSSYSVHELLSLASIIENEAILDEDRAIISSVFYNRLEIGMKLQSCATVGYALGEWKLTYTESDLLFDSPYNTYYYSGLPVGPCNNPGEESIKASIYPEETNYYYFLADVCSENPKTYFSETEEEHTRKAQKYLTC